MVPRSDICRISRDKDDQGNDVEGFRLDYSSCNLKHFQLPQGISPKDVTHLNLERTKIKAIPPIIFQMSHLKELDLRHNRLTSVPPEIKNLHRLRVLKLAMNSLKKLPEAIGEMESLEVLHLGANELTRLPKKFCNLKLKVIWINDNCFAHFPTQITQIKTIEELYAEGNQITTVPEEIGELSNMTCFLIHKNKLTSLPRSIVALIKSKLTDFDYHANRCLRVLPPGFDQAISKTNEMSDPHCNQTEHKSFGVKQKRTNGQTKSSKPASVSEAIKKVKVKEDNVVEEKATDEQAVASVTESSLLAASENGKMIASKCEDPLYSSKVTPDVGTKTINNFYGPVYLNVGNNDCQSTDESTTPVSCKEKSTMDTKDPVNDLIQNTASKASPSWRDIARQLGLKESEIERIEWEYRGKMKECCIKALNLWRGEKGKKDATVEVLKKALIDAGCKLVVDEFDDANGEFQDVADGNSGQVEEETRIMEAAGCSYSNVESDDRRDLTSTKAHATSIESQPIARRRNWCQKRRCKKRRAEPNQIPTEGGRRHDTIDRHQSRPGPYLPAGHETGVPDEYWFPPKKKRRIY